MAAPPGAGTLCSRGDVRSAQARLWDPDSEMAAVRAQGLGSAVARARPPAPRGNLRAKGDRAPLAPTSGGTGRLVRSALDRADGAGLAATMAALRSLERRLWAAQAAISAAARRAAALDRYTATGRATASRAGCSRLACGKWVMLSTL